MLGLVANRAWRVSACVTESRQGSGGLADAPFRGMQPIGAVSDMRRADVLAAGDHILDPIEEA